MRVEILERNGEKMENKQNISFWNYIYVITIAIIFLTIGLIFPNDFILFGIPGLGLIHYVIILYLFAAVGILYRNKM